MCYFFFFHAMCACPIIWLILVYTVVEINAYEYLAYNVWPLCTQEEYCTRPRAGPNKLTCVRLFRFHAHHSANQTLPSSECAHYEEWSSENINCTCPHSMHIQYCLPFTQFILPWVLILKWWGTFTTVKFSYFKKISLQIVMSDMKYCLWMLKEYFSIWTCILAFWVKLLHSHCNINKAPNSKWKEFHIQNERQDD